MHSKSHQEIFPAACHNNFGNHDRKHQQGSKKNNNTQTKKTQTAKRKNWKTTLHNLLGSAIFLWLLCANQTLAMKVFCSVQITTLLWRFSKCWGAKENTQTVKTWDHSTKLNWKSKKSKKQLKSKKIHENKILKIWHENHDVSIYFFLRNP